MVEEDVHLHVDALHAYLQAEHGYAHSYKSVLRYVRAAFPPPKSPSSLINASANSSSATFNVRGFAYNAANEKSIFVGTYTTQFENRSYQSLLNDIVAGIPVEKSYSASFTLTPIPEPGTLSIMLIGTGLLALGTLARRVRR